MDVQIKITADDKALEFSRNLSNFYANLVVSGFVADEKKEHIAKVDKTADVEKPEDDQDRPWETIEPDPIKVDEAPKEVESPKEEIEKKEGPAVSSHLTKEMKEKMRARANAYVQKHKEHGMAELKKILDKYGLPKLTAPGLEKYYDAIWAELEV
jgi:hypothetical protein